jgi:hypothetical protein
MNAHQHGGGIDEKGGVLPKPQVVMMSYLVFIRIFYHHFTTKRANTGLRNLLFEEWLLKKLTPHTLE